MSAAATASHDVSTHMAMITAPALVLVLLDLVAAQVPSQPGPCSWMRMKACYARIGSQNTITMFAGKDLELSAKMFAQLCATMTLPSPCFIEFSDCPAHVKANLSTLEEGYRQFREMNCDKKAIEDAVKLVTCMDVMSILLCSQQNLPTSDLLKLDQCSSMKEFSGCAEATLPKSCPDDYKALTSSLKRRTTASLLMMGCDTSSQTGLLPVNFYIALIAALSLISLQTT